MQLYDVEITASTVSSSTQKSVCTLAGWLATPCQPRAQNLLTWWYDTKVQ